MTLEMSDKGIEQRQAENTAVVVALQYALKRCQCLRMGQLIENAVTVWHDDHNHAQPQDIFYIEDAHMAEIIYYYVSKYHGGHRG